MAACDGGAEASVAPGGGGMPACAVPAYARPAPSTIAAAAEAALRGTAGAGKQICNMIAFLKNLRRHAVA
ncbi:hypothetical protein [Cupriavidus sp. MP-37]|uniref:hypothetical protein n=1 Tax=Cupriavidus sp. MP-37 TaxID=2884455 RepID=UPI001D0A753B|nr:hypothetical protein [Cupriavidus sp. MP-37]UDM52222.1 hypothetical protein LIN44_23630 [Cupriavidus sp. MP-37]